MADHEYPRLIRDLCQQMARQVDVWAAQDRGRQQQHAVWLRHLRAGVTRWQGYSAMRIGVSCWRTTEVDVERSLAAIVRAVSGATRE